MMKRQTLKITGMALLAGALILSSCSKDSDLTLPTDIPQMASTQSQAAARSAEYEAQLSRALPQIIQGLESIKASLDRLSIAPVSSDGEAAAPTTRSSTTRASSRTSTSTTRSSITRSSTTTRTATPKAPAKPAGPDAQAELATVLQKLAKAPFIKAKVEKTEKGMNSGKTKFLALDFWTKQPNVVKLDIVKSSATDPGTKATYTSGVGTKAKVRPAGALSFVTTEISKTDKRIVSDNGLGLEDLDFFGVTKRLLGGNYKAELVGRTTVAGRKINVLKITTSGTHPLNPKVQYEHLGYEPDSHTIRLWEMYSDEKTPFFRLTLPSIEFPSSIPDSEFKI